MAVLLDPAILVRRPGRDAPLRLPRLTMRPPLHSTAYSKSGPALDPTACPESLTPFAMLYVAAGRPPRLTGPPPLHSTAQPSLHWARAKPMLPLSRQIAAKMASPNDFQYDMSAPPHAKTLTLVAQLADDSSVNSGHPPRARTITASETQAGEAEQHHRPGRGFREPRRRRRSRNQSRRTRRRRDCTRTSDRCRVPKSEPRSMTLSRKKLSATDRLLKVVSRISTPLAVMVNSIDSKPSPSAKPVCLAVDQAEQQIAADKRNRRSNLRYMCRSRRRRRRRNWRRELRSRIPRRAAPAGRRRHCSRHRSASWRRPCREARSRRRRRSGQG